jgi:hypothetical protein
VEASKVHESRVYFSRHPGKDFARVDRTLLSDAFDLDLEFDFAFALTTDVSSTVEERRLSAA